jgi:hypothetical protein
VTAGARLPRRKGFEAARPPDVSDDRWQAALRGLSAFVAGGWADQAERLGWTRDELFRVPELWSQIHLTGAALLIGDREVIGVTPNEIRIRTDTGATQSFYRRPEVDYGLVFRERLKQIEGNYPPGSDEPRLRAIEFAVAEYRRNTGAELAEATLIVRAAVEKGKRP